MAGSSKHYILVHPDGTFWDYQIPSQLMKGALVGLDYPSGMRFRDHIGLLPSWRKKLLAIWNCGHLYNKHRMILTEYKVYPKKSYKACVWRQQISNRRAFDAKPKEAKKNPWPLAALPPLPRWMQNPPPMADVAAPIAPPRQRNHADNAIPAANGNAVRFVRFDQPPRRG